jgi:hypothetical protein
LILNSREIILTAFCQKLAETGRAVFRDGALPERVQVNGLIIIRDGEPNEAEVTLSPLRYHYQHRVILEVFTQARANRCQLMQICGEIGAIIAGDRTLCGYCDWIEAEAPEITDIPSEGAQNILAAIGPIRLYYALADPLVG